MRVKVVAVLLVSFVIVVGSLYFFRQTGRRTLQNQTTQTTDSGASSLPQSQDSVDGKDTSAAVASGNSISSNKAVTAAPDSALDQPKGYIETRVEQLMELGMDNDPASLEAILAELGNRAPEIRKAARDAAVQFGSRDAIPKLAEAAIQTDDAAEKADIQAAIEFLKLPSLTETLAQAGNRPRSVPKPSQPVPAVPPKPRPW
jgi:hypothetical protein